MKIKKRNRQNFRIKVDYNDFEFFKISSDDCIIYEKANSWVIETPNGNCIFGVSDNISYSVEDMQCFKSVKRDSRKFLELNKDFVFDVRKPEYFRQSDLIRTVCRNRNFMDVIYAYEVDLVSAYWVIARKFGFISEKTFEKFKHLKIARNAAIGNLGASVRVIKKEGGKVVSDEFRKENEYLNEIRLHIVNYCDYVINCIISNFDFYNYLFYWVDGIYFEDNGFYQGWQKINIEIMEIHLRDWVYRNFGIDIKVKKCIIYPDGEKIVRCYEDGKCSEFSFPKFYGKTKTKSKK